MRDFMSIQPMPYSDVKYGYSPMNTCASSYDNNSALDQKRVGQAQGFTP
jgi:hypothetical protein